MANLSAFLGGASPQATFQEVQASGVAGQDISANIDEVQIFNTDVVANNFVSRLGNQFTMESGSYIALLWYPIKSTSDAQFWIKDTSNVSYGGVKIRFDATNKTIGTTLQFSFTITESKTVELIARSFAVADQGVPLTPSNGDEYYKSITFIKIG